MGQLAARRSRTASVSLATHAAADQSRALGVDGRQAGRERASQHSVERGELHVRAAAAHPGRHQLVQRPHPLQHIHNSLNTRGPKGSKGMPQVWFAQRTAAQRSLTAATAAASSTAADGRVRSPAPSAPFFPSSSCCPAAARASAARGDLNLRKRTLCVSRRRASGSPQSVRGCGLEDRAELVVAQHGLPRRRHRRGVRGLARGDARADTGEPHRWRAGRRAATYEGVMPSSCTCTRCALFRESQRWTVNCRPVRL